MCPEHHSIMSPTSRIAGSTGKHHSFCAMYSLRMSVWIVPPSALGPDPAPLGRDHVEGQHDRRRRVDRHRHRHPIERDAGEQRLHVVERVDRDALAPDLAQRARMVGVEAHQRRHVERGREPGLPVIEQVSEPRVGLRSPSRSRRTGASSTADRGTSSRTRRGCTGYSPGNPIGSSSPPTPAGRSASVYSGLTGSPEIVENGASRSGARRTSRAPSAPTAPALRLARRSP